MGHAVIPGALCGSKSLSLDGGNSGQFRHFSPGPICAEQMGTTALLDSMGRRTKNPGSELDMDADGVARNPKILQSTPAGQSSISKNIERGSMPKVSGVIVHQTNSPNTSSVFSSYKNAGANGAHFLIDKDGTIYQTASLHQRTNHVGRLKSRCEAESRCSPEESRLNQRWDPKGMHARESVKPAGIRYPSNEDSIGIELVGMAHPAPGKDEPVYEEATEAQNAALAWLVNQLQLEYGFPRTEVFRHPDVSWKNVTEASTARW